MKLRIKGNSLRLRLGQSEVRRLTIEGRVAESTTFGPDPEQRLEYALDASAEARDVTASFAGGRVVVRVPRSAVLEWARTDQVGIHATQRISDDCELRILVEKDFECIDAPPAADSQEDAFPHPQREAAHACAAAMD
jgi:hypothetical protein